MRIVGFSIVALMVLVGGPLFIFAQTADELRNEIQDHSAEIEKLEEEIAQYEEELQEIGEEKQTLEGAVRQLDTSRRKIGATIESTTLTIDTTEYEIQELEGEIEDKAQSIARGTQALSEALRRMDEAERETFIETLLKSERLSDVWEDIETVQQFQAVMQERLTELASAKQNLEAAQQELEQKQETLIDEQNELTAQKRALDINRREKGQLLERTAEEEENYQALLAEKREAKAQFEKALMELESELQYTLDPSKLPESAEGILNWPFDNVRITQYFGNTQFASSGAYSGKGHNGIDLGAPIGTPVKAALSGTVVASGNTDAHAGCYSYGKWMLLRHPNGLSTLYAHLSDIAANSGASVATGEVIGYSGNTGYSTGPHLHFTVYVSDAVQIVRLGDVKTRTNCANAEIPVAPLNAYINPLNYL